MSIQLKTLLASARVYRFRDEAAVDTWLTERGVRDPLTRMSVKIELEAMGKYPSGARSVSAQAEESPRVLSPHNEIDRMARRAGIQDHRRYTIAQVDELLRASPFGPTEKIAIKHRLEELAMLV